MEDKFPVLIIGCGKIGALSDLNTEGIRTHTKAFVLNGSFRTTVYDDNQELAQKIASHYKIEIAASLEDEELLKYKVIVISTPTNTHAAYLTRLLQLNIPVVLCEKPISNSLKELKDLRRLKKSSETKVLVNYFRRFQPAYQQLKSVLENQEEQLTNIHIAYQRGFLNNATHALDLLDFLLGESDLEKVKIGSHAFDEFEDDPTITIYAEYLDKPLVMQGLENAKFSFFELTLWFEKSMISIKDNGSKIVLHSNPGEPSAYYRLLQPQPSVFDNIDAIKDPFEAVAAKVQQLLLDSTIEDNFESSYRVNYRSKKIIKKLCQD